MKERTYDALLGMHTKNKSTAAKMSPKPIEIDVTKPSLIVDSNSSRQARPVHCISETPWLIPTSLQA